MGHTSPALKALGWRPLRLFLIAAAFAPAQLHAANRDLLLADRVALPCWIENEKVIAVVNSTGKPLPAGSKLTVNAVQIPQGTHFVYSTTLGKTPSGAVFRIGRGRSSSCTASVAIPAPVTRGP